MLPFFLGIAVVYAGIQTLDRRVLVIGYVLLFVSTVRWYQS